MADAQIQALLDTTDRYEATSIPVFEEYLKKQIAEEAFNLEVSLALVKLYQFYPEKLNLPVLLLVLTQALAQVECQAFSLALYMLSDKTQQNESVALLITLSEHLESAQFRDFWDKLSRSTLVPDVPGFKNKIRTFIASIFLRSAKSVAEYTLSSALGFSEFELLPYARQQGWTVSEGKVVFPDGTQPTPKVAHENIQFNQLTNILQYLK